MKMQIEDLANAADKLGPRDRDFAQSLISQFRRRGLSAKQADWVSRLLERATNPSPTPATIPVDLGGVVGLLETAKRHLKHPAVLVLAGGRTLRLSIAGASAKAPGSINVCSPGGFGDREWFGRVTRDGQFEPSERYDSETKTAIGAALVALAQDPAKAAADYGHLTGVCCFCNTPLTDDRSTAVGYGPVCAKHFGLPWGTTAARKAA